MGDTSAEISVPEQRQTYTELISDILCYYVYSYVYVYVCLCLFLTVIMMIFRRKYLHVQDNWQVHVTSVQRESHPEDVEDNRRQRGRLYDKKRRQSTLELRHLLSNLDADAAGALWDSLVDLVVKTVLVALPHLYLSYRLCRVGKNVVDDGRARKERSVCFEILGFDVVIDRTLRPFLLEVRFTVFVCLGCVLASQRKEGEAPSPVVTVKNQR